MLACPRVAIVAALSINLTANLIGNTAGITTPIIIGYIREKTGSFEMALVYVGFMALTAIISYLLIVGEIRRVEFTPEQLQGRAG